MRSRGKCSGSGRRAGLRRSNDGTAIFSAAICAAVSDCAAFSSRSASCSSSWSSNAPRSEDCPNCSCRSFLIVSLSFSISNVPAWASASAASRAARSARSITCSVVTSSGRESSAPIADQRITRRGLCPNCRSCDRFKSRRSAGCLRTPRALRHPPVNPLKQIAKLGWGDRHHAIRRRRPEEAAALQPLGIERHAKPIVPKDLDQLAALAAEYIEVAAVRVALEGFLHQQGQRVHAAPHVGVAGRNPYPHGGRNRDHCRCPSASTATAVSSVAVSTAPVIRIRTPAANSISIAPLLVGPTGPGVPLDCGITIAGTKPTCCAAAPVGSGRNNRRHRSSNEREMPYRRAVAATWRGACKLSRTILSFLSSDQRRRRPVSTTSSRSTCALRLSLSIRTVLNNTPHSARRPSPDGYPPPSHRQERFSESRYQFDRQS